MSLSRDNQAARHAEHTEKQYVPDDQPRGGRKAL
jgi:hypothetical protein